MASIEQRLQAVEAAIDNSRITPELGELVNVLGNELITVWNPATASQNRYPLSEVFGSGSVDPTNDILPLFEQVDNIDFQQNIETQIATYINNSDQFTKTGSQIKWYFITRLETNVNQPSGFNTIREFYLFTRPKGNYGSGSGNTVVATDLFLQFKLKDNEGTTQTISLNATSPYDIETLVNNSTPVLLSQSATIIFDINVSGQADNDYYLYIGESGITVGSGESQTSSTDFVFLNNASPDPIDTSSFITFDEAINEINNAIGNITYDTSLSDSSNNAVQNLVVTNKFNSENMELINASGLDLTDQTVLQGLNNKAILVDTAAASKTIEFTDTLSDDFNILIYANTSAAVNTLTLLAGGDVSNMTIRNVGTDEINIAGPNKDSLFDCYPIFIQKANFTNEFTGFGVVDQGTISQDENEPFLRSTFEASQTLTDGQFTILDYDTASNTDAAFTLNANGQITINESGIYTISAGVVLRAGLTSAAETTALGIFVNDEIIDLDLNRNLLASQEDRPHSLCTQISLNQNDVVDARAFIESTGGGVLDFLALFLPQFFGLSANQINHISIKKGVK